MLAWTLALPFFLMPGPLTIEAPDIYGGFGLHLRAAAGLAAMGLLIGLAVLRLGPRVDEEGPAGRGTAIADAALAVLLAAGLGAALLVAAGRGGAWLAGLQSTGGGGRPVPPVQPPLPAALGAVLLLVRATLDRRPGAPLRLLALGSLLAGSLAWIGAASTMGGTSCAAAGWLLGGACAVAACAWGARGTAPRLPRSIWTLAAAVPPALAGALFGMDVAARLAPPSLVVLGCGWELPGLLAGALAGGLLGTQIALAAAAPSPGGPAWRLAWTAASHGALGALLAAIAFDVVDYSTAAAESWGFLLEPVRGPLNWRGHPRGLDPAAQQLWRIAFVSGGLLAGSGAMLRRWLGAVAALWGALVLGQVAAQGDGVPSFTTAHAGAIAVLMAGSWYWLLRLRWLPLAWAGMAGAAAAGPVLLWYLSAAVLVEPLSPALLLVLGSALGGLLAVPLAPGGSPTRIGAARRFVGVVFLSVAGVMPVYAGVSLGLYPGFTLALAGSLLAVSLAAWLWTWRRGRARHVVLLIGAWTSWYGCTAAMTWFKAGPSAEACRSVIAGTGARVLIDRFEEGGDYVLTQPYDVLPVPAHDVVLATFKRIDGRAGFIELIEPDRPGERSRLDTRGRAGQPLWPERMEYDPVQDAVVTQILGTEDYALWDVRVRQPDPDNPMRLRLAGDLPIPWEPGNPALDLERRRIVVTFVPNRTSDNPLLRVYRLDGLSPLYDSSRPGARLEIADYAAVDPATGRFYVPAWYDAVRFVLVEFDGDTGAVTRQRETGFGSVGLAVEDGRLYLTDSLAGGLYVLRLDDLGIEQVLPAGGFPRDVVLDRRRHRLYVGGYADGVVRSWSTAGRDLLPLSQVEVGPLLRGLGLDPETGRVYAASGCGLFEVAGREGEPPERDPGLHDGDRRPPHVP